MKNIFILAVFLGGIHSAQAVDYFSPRTAAMGGAGRGGPIGTDSLYLLPAVASFHKTYAAGVGLHSYIGREDSEPKGRMYNASIVDGSNPWFQAGVGYTRRADAKLLHFGASKAATQWLGFGIGAKRFFAKPGFDDVNQFSASGVLDLASFLKATFIVDNLLQNAESRSWNLYREYGLGLKASLGNVLNLYFDPSYSPNRPGAKYGYAVAGELMIFQGFYARYGWNRNTMQPHLGIIGRGMGFGGGFLFPRLALDFAIYRSQAPYYTSGKLIQGTISF